MILPHSVREKLKKLAEVDPTTPKGESMQRRILLDEYIEKIKKEYPKCFNK